MPLDPTFYYEPARAYFPELARRFAATGRITSEEMYLILAWKAGRARTRQRDRLVSKAGGSFGAAVKSITAGLRATPDPEQRLKLLMNKWGFRLPTASAILAVLYPKEFTVYDVRVCNVLGDFNGLRWRPWSPTLWQEYRRFMQAVRKKAPRRLKSWPDCDRWLWGRDRQKAMLRELGNRR